MPRTSPPARSRPRRTPSRPETTGPRETSNHHVAHGHPNAPSPTRWSALQSGPEAAQRYRRRFLDLEASGEDVHGEARFITTPRAAAFAGARRRVRLRPGREQADPVGAHRDRRRRRRGPHRPGSRGLADPLLRRRPVDPRPAHRAGVRLCRHGRQRRALPRRRHAPPGARPPRRPPVPRWLPRRGLRAGRLAARQGGSVDLRVYDRLAEAAGLSFIARYATWDEQRFAPGRRLRRLGAPAARAPESVRPREAWDPELESSSEPSPHSLSSASHRSVRSRAVWSAFAPPPRASRRDP